MQAICSFGGVGVRVLTGGVVWLFPPRTKNQIAKFAAAITIMAIKIINPIFQKLVLFSIAVIKADFSQKNKLLLFKLVFVRRK